MKPEPGTGGGGGGGGRGSAARGRAAEAGAARGGGGGAAPAALVERIVISRQEVTKMTAKVGVIHVRAKRMQWRPRA